MIRLISLGALLLAPPTYAQPRHHDLSPMRIVVETIPHKSQRYPTVGDWQIKPDGLHITVSRMSDQRYEFLVAMHEAIEAYLAIHAGLSPEAVDRFDRAYEARRKKGDDSEPGDDPKAPHHKEHRLASQIERVLARWLEVDWGRYSSEVESK